MEEKRPMTRGNTNFWDVLLTAVYRNGLTAAAVCEKLGLSRAYISKGKGTNTTPLVDTAARLLGACGYVLAALPGDSVPPDALVIQSGGDDLPE